MNLVIELKKYIQKHCKKSGELRYQGKIVTVQNTTLSGSSLGTEETYYHLDFTNVD